MNYWYPFYHNCVAKTTATATLEILSKLSSHVMEDLIVNELYSSQHDAVDGRTPTISLRSTICWR
mgnify:CR=1 FL=1